MGQVLQAVPQSRLLLLAPRGQARERVLAKLEQEGIAASRVEFADRQPRQEYLKLYHRIDLGLDPAALQRAHHEPGRVLDGGSDPHAGGPEGATRQRQAVAYHYLAGLPYAEVAAIIGGSTDAARRAAADGIAAIRRTYPGAAKAHTHERKGL